MLSDRVCDAAVIPLSVSLSLLTQPAAHKKATSRQGTIKKYREIVI